MLKIFFPLIIFLFGLSVGSFLNALVWRMQTGKSIFWKRSQCPRCGHELKSLDLIPIFSFIFLFGRCRYCKRKISFQYPLVEIFTAFLFVVFFAKSSYLLNFGQFFSNIEFWSSIFLQWFFVAILVGIFLYDIKYGLIPDRFTVIGVLIGFVAGIFLGVSIGNMLLGALIGGGFFLIQFLISRGKWIGGGDIRLGVLMGVILGYPHIILAFFISYILGSIVGLTFVAFRKRGLKSNIPFGPFLVTGTLITMLAGDWIMKFVGLYL